MARPLEGPASRLRPSLEKLENPGVIRVCRWHVRGIEEKVEVAPGRHGPEEAGVDERLVEDGEALLRTFDVGEMEGVDLSPGQGPSRQGVLGARSDSAPNRLRVGRRRRDRPFALPGAKHPEGRILVEEVLEVRRPRPGKAGQEDWAPDVRGIDARLVGGIGIDLDPVAQRDRQHAERDLETLGSEPRFVIHAPHNGREVLEEVHRVRILDIGQRHGPFDDHLHRQLRHDTITSLLRSASSEQRKAADLDAGPRWYI